jgi:hypothetical protein
VSYGKYRKMLDDGQVKSQSKEGFEALTQDGIRASSHPPVSMSHQRSKSMKCTYLFVKCFYNFFDADAHSPPPPSMPRIPSIAKAVEMAGVVMVMVSPPSSDGNRHIRACVATICRIRIRRIRRIRRDITPCHGTEHSQAEQNQPNMLHCVPYEF